MDAREYARLLRGMSDDTRALNEGSLGGKSTTRRGRGKRPDVGTSSSLYTPSPLEVKFALAWRAAKGPPLTLEYKFHPTRRWRADFAHLPSRTLIELEGGILYKSRHTSPKGFQEDCRKYNAAAALDFAVFRLPTGFKQADVNLIVDYIRRHTP